MPVADILRYNSLTWPDRVGLIAGDRRITFSELEQAVWRLNYRLNPKEWAWILAA